jgi:hypothetical protein
MKLIYTALLTIALTGTYTATAQTGTAPVKQEAAKEKLTEGPEYDKYYEKLKELHIEHLRSESYKKSRALNKAFVKKMNYKGRNFMEISKDMLGWVKENFSQTSFESYEAAEKEWAAVNAATMESVTENKEYYDYMRECLQKCDTQLIKDVLRDIMEEHPEVFYGE